jgi:aquaporin Z
VLGTFALTFVAAGTVMAGDLSHGQVDHIAKAIAPGLVVMALIYAFGDVSARTSTPRSRSRSLCAATSRGDAFLATG